MRRHHIDALLSLDGKLFPMLVEWQVAEFYIDQLGAKLEWVSGNGPEFIARTDSLEWEVECKRISPNITELLREGISDLLAKCVANEVYEMKLMGELLVTVPDGVETGINDATLEALRLELRATIQQGDVNIKSALGLTIEGRLAPHSDELIEVSDFQNQPKSEATRDCRTYGFALARRGKAVNPIIVRITGPRRQNETFLDHLWDRKFQHAANQCSRTRGAVLVFEWSAVTSPRVFAESEGVRALIARTFTEHKHVASIVLRTGPLRTEGNGFVSTRTEAYVTRSEVTHYPDIAKLEQYEERL